MNQRLLIAALSLAIAGLSGCTDLPDVEPEGCGNLVLNADEDCDGFSDKGDNTACGAPETENACFFICDEAAGTVCPDGWGCGSDGRCRRANGRFEPGPGSPWRFRVGDFAVGDVDGDGNNDLIGNDVQTVTVRYGSETGEFAAEIDVSTREPFGRLSYAKFDDDDLLDVLVPIANGLFVMLGDEERTLEPVAYSPFEVAIPSGGARLFPVESDGGANLNSELLVIAGDSMEFLNSTAGGVKLPTGCPAGQCTVTDIAGKVPVADLDADPVGRREFALAFRGHNTVYVYTSGGNVADGSNNLTPTQYAAVSLPAGTRVDLGSFLADIDGDGWKDLMVSVRNATDTPRVVVALNNGSGGFAPAVVRLVYDRGDSNASVWPLAVGQLAGDEKADYVFPDFIAIADLNVPNPLALPVILIPTQFITNQQWTEAAIGEFNGDEVGDVATTIEGRDGVDVFLGAPVDDGLGGKRGSGIFNKFHIDTDDPPLNLRVADFDGDFILDIAFAESGFGSKPDAISVIFGNTAGGPTDPVRMGEMGFVEIIEPISSVVSIEGIDAIADLFVLTSSFPDRDTTAVALLQGSSSRRMLSPFTLQPPGDGEEPDIPFGALFGNFSPNGDGIPDIVAVAEAAPDFDASTPNQIRVATHLWMVPGSVGDGQLNAGGAGFIELPDAETFDTGCALWTAGDLDGGDTDEIIGIDNSLECYGFGFSPAPRLAVSTIQSGAEPFSVDVDELTTVGRAPRKLDLVDLDGDGDRDLLILFAGEVRGSTGGGGGQNPIEGAAVVVLWNDGSGLSLSNPTELTFSSGRRLFDVEAIRLDDTGVPSVAILASGGVFVAKLDPETAQYTQPELLFAQAGDGRLEVGDLNGDGLDDIAYTIGDDVSIALAQPDIPLGAQLAPAPEPADEGGDQ